tara:strand:+ start:1008 stop:3854 length:2847 start_codon:yes stop_codon:yes gene_type:complete
MYGVGALGIIGLVLIGVGAADTLDSVSTSALRSVFNTIQYLSVSLNLSFEWPGPVLDVADWFASFNFGIQIFAPECITGFDWTKVFWGGVVGAPVMIFGTIFCALNFAKLQYKLMVRSIRHDKELGYYFKGKFGAMIGHKKTCISWSGDKVLYALHKKYKVLASFRKFFGLCMTVIYLPVINLCLQAFDCYDVGSTRVLSADAKVDCDSETHVFVQSVAGIVGCVVGIGIPLFVLLRVRHIRVRNKLDDNRVLDAAGAWYEVFRRPATDALEIVNRKVTKTRRKKKYGYFEAALARLTGQRMKKTTVYGGGPADGEEEEEEEEEEKMRRGKDSDGKAVEKTFDAKSFRIKSRETVFEETKKAKTTEMQIKPQLEKIKTMAKSLERQNLSNGPNAENEVYTIASLFAVHYMTIELANKLIVVLLAQQAGGGEISGALMLPIYAGNAFLVYFIQPWRRITVSFGPIRVRNVMNRADVMNFCGQGLVIIIAFALDGSQAETGTVLVLCLVGMLTLLRTFVLFSMIYEKVKQKLKKTEASFNEDPVGARKAAADQFYAIATSAQLAEVGLFVYKFETDVNRRRAVGRLEECREYLLHRAERCKERHANNKRALMMMTKSVSERIESLQPPPPPKEDMEKLLREAEKPAMHAGDLIEKHSEGEFLVPATRILHEAIVSFTKSTRRCENLARVYADCEMINELYSVSCDIKRFSYDAAQLSLKFGYVEALKYEERVMEVTNKEAVISMRRESFEGFLSALQNIESISQAHDNDLMEIIELVEHDVPSTDRALADACIESLTRNFVNSKVKATRNLKDNWISWIPYLERAQFSKAVNDTLQKEKQLAAALKQNDKFGAKRIEQTLDVELNAYVADLEAKIVLLSEFECSDVCNQVKNAAIRVYTDKIASARNPRNGIRAQAKPGWTDAIGDFFSAFGGNQGQNKREEYIPESLRE